METKEAASSYYTSRMQQLGISGEQNTISVEYTCYDDSTPRKALIFSENEQKGIDILYVGLNGLKTYLKNGKREMPYVRTRVHPDHEKNGLPKYLTPRGAGTQVFIPPLVLNAYNEQRPINTLFITEGEFKAMKASMNGLFCIGTQGIHNTHERDERENRILNTEVDQLIKTCKVKNVILLFDNDCLTVDFEEDKDLYKRPNSFFTAVKNFREYTKHLSSDVYFSHLRIDLAAKGIDDLLCSANGEEQTIIDDLLAINKQDGKYVVTQNITEKSLKSLKSYFHINSVQEFYAEYEEILTDNKFRYDNAFYKAEKKGEGEDAKYEVKLLINDAIMQYIRVANDYYKRIQIPDRTGKLVPTLAIRTRPTINDDFGRKAFEYIPKYEAFTLVPSHHQYKQVIENCYNAYHQLSHQPLPGTISYSLAMVKHIFKDKYDFGLDYLQLLYMKPEQLLPILLLQSKERNTGKSTFGQWLIEIFQTNAVKLGNSDLENEFNSTYAERLVIVVDETTLSKKVTSEAIKRMSTEQGKIFVNAKGLRQYETDWIGKFIFITNTLNTALYIGKGEMRYFVRTIDTLPATDDPDMMEKLRDEVPAFLHFLTYRSLHHARRGRMYFDFPDYKTPELGTAIEENISSMERELVQLVEDTFDAFPDVSELLFSLSDIAAELKDRSKYKVAESDLKKLLQTELGIEPQTQRRYDYYSLKISQQYEGDTAIQKRNGKPYTFSRQRFRP